jgi:non-ribosomal peptide synthetase component E (peptide arylation enzyme)
MRIDGSPISAQRMHEFRAAGYWVDGTTNKLLEGHAQTSPDELGAIERRV